MPLRQKMNETIRSIKLECLLSYGLKKISSQNFSFFLQKIGNFGIIFNGKLYINKVGSQITKTLSSSFERRASIYPLSSLSFH
jgi:hypothetical protein